jgi:hypothetical protein
MCVRSRGVVTERRGPDCVQYQREDLRLPNLLPQDAHHRLVRDGGIKVLDIETHKTVKLVGFEYTLEFRDLRLRNPSPRLRENRFNQECHRLEHDPVPGSRDRYDPRKSVRTLRNQKLSI